MEKAAATAKSKIVLDVGGTRFATSKTSLRRFPETYFTGLLGSGKWQPDEDGTYFVDRNPKGFEYVLDYLRTGELSIEGLKREILEKVKGHIDYFLLPVPESLKIVWNPAFCGTNLTIEGKKVSKTANGGAWNAGVLGTAMNPASFKVKILNRGASGNIMLGLAPQPTFKMNGSNYTSSGFYIQISNGTLYSQQGDGARAYRNTAVNNNSVVEVILNAQTKQISFAVDGTNHGVAFTVNTPDYRLFPAIDFHDQGGTVEFC